MENPIQNQNQKASALIITVVMIVVIAGLTGALVMASAAHYQINRTHKAGIICEYAARGGLNIATMVIDKIVMNTLTPTDVTRIEGQMDDLSSVIYYTGAVGSDLVDNWFRLSDNAVAKNLPATSPAGKVFAVRAEKLTDRDNRHFRVNIAKTVLSNTPPEPDTITFNARSSACYDKMTFAVAGYITRVIRDVYDPVTKTKIITRPGVTGYKSLVVNANGSIDSYASDVGAYGPTNRSSFGHIGSNGTIDVSGSQTTMVYGNVTGYGPLATVTGVNTGEVAGTVSTDNVALPFPSKLATDWITHTTETFTEAKKGDTVISGTKYYDSISFKGNVRISGNTVIYCRGDFQANAQGNLIIDPGASLVLHVAGSLTYNGGFEMKTSDGSAPDPARFTIKGYLNQRGITSDPNVIDPNSTTDGYGWKFNGGSSMYGVVDAPWTNIKILGNSEIFGSMVGYQLLVGGALPNDNPKPRAKVHYDQKLSVQVETTVEEMERRFVTEPYILHTVLRGAFQDSPSTTP